MPRRIDTQAVIYAVRLDEQGSDPAQPAAGYRIIYAKDDGIYEEDDAGVVTGPFGSGGGDVLTQIVNGRLTLTTATPVTTADVTGATTLYFTPYKGNQIALYDGASAWELLSFTEKSLSLVGYTASKPYDIWAYNNGGTVALESTVWTNATTRATALTTQDGVYVKTGATTRRYLGTIYINASGGQTDDTSAGKRNVFNYYNRVLRTMHKEEGTNHTYNSTVGRYWNNDSTQLFEFMTGVLEDPIIADVKAVTTGSASNPRVFLSLDSNTFDNNYPFAQNGSGSLAIYDGQNVVIPNTLGRHYLAISEQLQTGSTSSTFTTVFVNVAVFA